MNAIAQAETRIKQLCCLGLPSEAVMPAVLDELHALIPAYANNFFWVDDSGQISNVYQENFDETAPMVPLFLSEFCNRREAEVMKSFAEVLRCQRGVKTLDAIMKVDKRTFHRHDYYNLIHRPAHYHDALCMVARAGDQAVGMMISHRGAGDTEFTARDKRFLAILEPFLVHAVSGVIDGVELQAPLVDDETRGLLIVDRDHKVQHASPEARKLLFLATHSQVTATSTAQVHAAPLPLEVVRLCRNLVAVFEGRQGAVAPPVWRHRNSWGGFVFRAYWLDNGNRLDSLIGITIEHQVPLPVKLIRQMERFSLSRRQVQLCLYMASGLSCKKMAQRMDVKESTAIYHSRELYTKLDVHNRTELMNKLMAA